MSKILKVFICTMLFSYCSFGFAQSVADFVAEFNVSHYNFENKYLNTYVNLDINRFSNIYLSETPSVAIINYSGCKIKAFFSSKKNIMQYLSKVDYSQNIIVRGKLDKIQNTNNGVVFLLEDCDVNEYDSANEFSFGGPFDMQQYLRDVAYIGKWENDAKSQELKYKYFCTDKIKFSGRINKICNQYGQITAYVSNPDFGKLAFVLCKGYYDKFTLEDLQGAFLGHTIDIFGNISCNSSNIFWRDILDCRFDISYSELEQIVKNIRAEKEEKAIQNELQRIQAEENAGKEKQAEALRQREEEKKKQDEADKKIWENERNILINSEVGDEVVFGFLVCNALENYHRYAAKWVVLAVDGSKRLLFGKHIDRDRAFGDHLNVNTSWKQSHVRAVMNSKDFYDAMLNKYEQSSVLVSHNNYTRYYSKEKVIQESSDDTVFVLSREEYDLYINKNRPLQKKIYISDTILRDTELDKNGQEHFVYVEQEDGKKPKYELTHGGRGYNGGICVWIDTSK